MSYRKDILVEKPRLRSGLFYFDENIIENKKISGLIGVDEAGRGPLAGPVVACAVYLERDIAENLSQDINDSKKISAKRREALFKEMIASGVKYSFSYSGNEEIDKMNILNATLLAMKKAVENLYQSQSISPTDLLVIVDGPHKIKNLNLNQMPIIDGDAKSLSIACASIFAKVLRDRWMDFIDREYPNYNFKKHKGYGTKLHMEMLKKYGICKYHRKSFAPIKYICEK
jgi:ribonuclease HII